MIEEQAHLRVVSEIGGRCRQWTERKSGDEGAEAAPNFPKPSSRPRAR